MEIYPAKESFKVGENIEFAVILTNKSNHNLYFKELNNDTVYFIFDGAPWGAQKYDKEAVQKAKQIIVKSGESIRKSFVAGSYIEPKEFEIYGSYALTYKGVRPSARSKVVITK
ncbi:MAG: hypothetical protein HQL27_09280 [Candidatus Omnitrophica bacterium]|nr:hypothetical protein [Candidatus Omnitrophota bacterium]